MATINIKKLRKEYGMSQEDLAQRLGMSRPTLVKIESGKRALTVPERKQVEDIFELVGDITQESGTGYLRINIPQKNIEKFKQVLLYILEKVGGKPNVGLTVLYKLLYFIDFDYYEKYETQLMGLTYFNNKQGPTPREFVKVVEQMKDARELEEVKSKFFKYEQKKFLPLMSPDLSVLTGRELEMIDDVLARYSDKSAKELSDMTHKDTPWRVTKLGEDINYEYAFYRLDEFSVRDYGEL